MTKFRMAHFNVSITERKPLDGMRLTNEEYKLVITDRFTKMQFKCVTETVSGATYQVCLFFDRLTLKDGTLQNLIADEDETK